MDRDGGKWAGAKSMAIFSDNVRLGSRNGGRNGERERGSRERRIMEVGGFRKEREACIM